MLKNKRTHHFKIVSSATVQATPVELSEIVLDPDALSRWCPGVFMESQLVEPGAANGLGMTIKACSKGWLPFGFSFQARVVDLEEHKWTKVELSGDFDGYGLLTAEQVGGGWCNISMHLDVEVWHPVLRLFLAPLKPLFLLNHKWAARKGTRQLQKEIYRRRKLQ